MRVIFGTLGVVAIMLCCAANSFAVDVGNVVSANNSPKLHMNASGDYVVSWIDLLKKRPVRVITGNVNGRAPKLVGLGGERPDALEANISAGIAADGSVNVSWRRSPQPSPEPPASANVLRWAIFAPRKARPKKITSHELANAYFRETGDHLAVSANGGAISSWVTAGDANSASVMSIHRPAGGPSLPSASVYTETSPAGVNDVRGYMDANGTPTLVWSRGEWGSGCDADGNNCEARGNANVQLTSGDGKGGFLPVESFGVNGNCEFGDFDESASGAAVLVLKCWTAGSGFLVYATRHAGQTFGELRQLTLPAPGHFSYSKDDFPDAKVLPDGRVIVAWLHYSRWIENTRRGRSTHIGRMTAATGIVGGELGPSRFLTGNVRAEFSSIDTLHIDPVPQLSISPSGRAYLSGRLRGDDRCRIAAISPYLSLGKSHAYAPAQHFCAEIEIASSGRAMTLVPYSRGFGFRIVKLRVPRASQ